MQPQQPHAEFPPTHWTYIDALKAKDHPHHLEARETLASLYWPPIYAYLRRRGKSHQDAAELTQAFFADVVLQRRLFERADPQRGRLRLLILTALKHYVQDEARRRRARRADVTLSLDQLRQEDAMVAGDSSSDADQAFDRRWVTAVLEKALRQCERHFRASGREKHWNLFEVRVMRPALAMTPAPSLGEAAREAGFASAAEAAGALRAVRKRAITLLHEAVAETADRDGQQAEYRFLESLLH